MRLFLIFLMICSVWSKSVGSSKIKHIIEQLNLNEDPEAHSKPVEHEKEYRPIHDIPYDFKQEAKEHEVDYSVLENCREFVNPKPKNARQCILRRKYIPDDRSYDDDDNFDEEAFDAETASAFRRFKVSRCRWDHEAEVCLCPRSQEMCYSKKLKDKCYWYEEPKHSYDYDGYKVEHESSDGECISNAERFYNILHKLLIKRGKKDFAIRLKYNSVPARSELPYGPHGPSIIKYGTSSRKTPNYYNRYFTLSDNYGHGSYVPTSEPSYLQPISEGHGGYGTAGPYPQNGYAQSYGNHQGYHSGYEQKGYGGSPQYGQNYGQAYSDPSYNSQTYGGQAYSDQTHGGQAYGSQTHGSHAYGSQTHGGQAYGGQTYGEQTYGGQGHSYVQQQHSQSYVQPVVHQQTYGPQQETQHQNYMAQDTYGSSQQGSYETMDYSSQASPTYSTDSYEQPQMMKETYPAPTQSYGEAPQPTYSVPVQQVDPPQYSQGHPAPPHYPTPNPVYPNQQGGYGAPAPTMNYVPQPVGYESNNYGQQYPPSAPTQTPFMQQYN